MAKDKKSKKAKSEKKLEIFAGPESSGTESPKASAKKSKKEHGGLDGLMKLADHPLLADLLAVGALAAVAAITDSNKQSLKGKSGTAVKAAGKAAALAIGARLLKEVTSGGDVKEAVKKV